MEGDAESDDGCSGSRSAKLRLLAAAGAECVLHHRLLLEQLAVILKCIKEAIPARTKTY